MARFTSSRRVTRRPRRKLVWARSLQSVATAVTAGGVTSTNLLADFETQLGANLIGSTIMRIRGQVHFFWDTATTTMVDATAQLGWGIQVLNSAQSTPGPSPLGNRYDDWMAYGVTTLIGSDGTGVPEALSGGGFDRIAVDVRSRRKIDEIGQELRFVAAGSSDNTLTCRVMTNLSTLIMLP